MARSAARLCSLRISLGTDHLRLGRQGQGEQAGEQQAGAEGEGIVIHGVLPVGCRGPRRGEPTPASMFGLGVADGVPVGVFPFGAWLPYTSPPCLFV